MAGPLPAGAAGPFPAGAAGPLAPGPGGPLPLGPFGPLPFGAASPSALGSAAASFSSFASSLAGFPFPGGGGPFPWPFPAKLTALSCALPLAFGAAGASPSAACPNQAGCQPCHSDLGLLGIGILCRRWCRRALLALRRALTLPLALAAKHMGQLTTSLRCLLLFRGLGKHALRSQENGYMGRKLWIYGTNGPG